MYTNHALIQYSYDRYIETLPLEKQALLGNIPAPLMGGLIGGGLGLGAAALSGKKNKPWLRNLLIGAGLGGLGGYGYDKFQDFQASQQDGGSRFMGPPSSAMNAPEKAPSPTAKLPSWEESAKGPTAQERMKALPPGSFDGGRRATFGSTPRDKTQDTVDFKKSVRPLADALSRAGVNYEDKGSLEQGMASKDPNVAEMSKLVHQKLFGQDAAPPRFLDSMEETVGEYDRNVRGAAGAMGTGIYNATGGPGRAARAAQEAEQAARATQQRQQDSQALQKFLQGQGSR